MTDLEYLFAYSLTVYQSGKSIWSFVKTYIVRHDSVQETSSIIKFCFELDYPANSSMPVRFTLANSVFSFLKGHSEG